MYLLSANFRTLYLLALKPILAFVGDARELAVLRAEPVAGHLQVPIEPPHEPLPTKA